MSRRLVVLSLIVGVLAIPLRASDPVGIYALIDRVVLEPDADNPSAVQIWGVFALAQGSGFTYQPAQRGYLYYSLNTTNPRATRAEWSDLRSVAGKAQPIGFGQRYKPVGRIRPPSEPPSQPDTYPLGFGLVKVLPELLGPTTKRELERVPALVEPPDGGRVRPGAVRLVARNVADAKVQYVFEIESASGERQTSTPIAAGQQQTTWTPQLVVRTGETYTWRVWTIDGSWRSPATSATFRGGQ